MQMCIVQHCIQPCRKTVQNKRPSIPSQHRSAARDL
jgi:hypothetical protein